MKDFGASRVVSVKSQSRDLDVAWQSALCKTGGLTHAGQTNASPHRGHIQPGREGQTAERDCTSEPRPIRQRGSKEFEKALRVTEKQINGKTDDELRDKPA